MAVAAMLELRASYKSGEVRMEWKHPRHAPEAVHIYMVRMQGQNLTLDPKTHKVRYLNKNIRGTYFDCKIDSDFDVRKVDFCVFLSDYFADCPLIEELKCLNNCFTSVVIGSASISYKTKSRVVDNALIEHRISLHSSSEIEEGVLGYFYRFNDKEILLKLPEQIPVGLTEYPPIFLPNGTEPAIRVIGGEAPEISIVKNDSAKRSIFAGLFSRGKCKKAKER